MAKKPKKKTKKELEAEAKAAAEAEAAQAAETAGASGEAAASGPMLQVLVQYVKDMSFENPNAPESLRAGLAQPEVNIDIQIGRSVGEDDTVEVVIMLRANATREGATVFIAELQYAGLFAFRGASMEEIQPMIMIECPRILFPFARKLLADMTQDGGYPPIMLDMPDFAAMFREELMRRAQDASVN